MIPSVNYSILASTLHALKQGDFLFCENLGFTPDELNALNQLSLEEFFFISRASTQFMTVTVRHDALKHILALSHNELQRQQQIDRAIKLGGSIALLTHYFGLTSNEVCLRRRLLRITSPHGRTPIPDEQTDAEIWLRWRKYGPQNIESMDALEAMMQITESFSSLKTAPSLTVIWNRITLCEKQISGRRDAHAR